MRRLKPLLILIIAFTSCQILPLKENDYYTRQQMEMIEKTSDSINLGFGFDSRIDINYFFFKTEMENEGKTAFGGITPSEEIEGEAQFDKDRITNSYTKAINQYNDTEQADFYERVYRLYSMIEYLQDYYRRNKKWRLFNLMRLELYPATRYYMDITEYHFKTNKPQLYNVLVKRKSEIKKDAILFVQKKYTIVDEY
jgi:hypothetical protein